MSRRTVARMEHDAAAALSEALELADAAARVIALPSPGERFDLVVETDSQRFDVEVKSVVTAVAGAMLAERTPRDAPLIVVADRIAAAAKESLRAAGVNFFDRRGELWIASPSLCADTRLDLPRPPVASAGGPLDSQVAKEAAIACMLAPRQPHGVRQIARCIDRAPSAVSVAMAGLRDVGLLTSDGEAMVPELFDALAAVWHRRPVALAALPDRGDATRLGLGLDAPEDSTGWALTDTRAAMSWGIPIIASGDYPPDFLVPSEPALRSALSHLAGAPTPGTRACTVSVAPVRLACTRRVDHSHTTGERWPVANHIVVALDMAQDKARGLEALDQWQPGSIDRAW